MSLNITIMNEHKCETCKFIKPVFCHPMNKTIGNGQITRQLGWICEVTIDQESELCLFFDHLGVGCELWEDKD